jgi:hypothetical protein
MWVCTLKFAFKHRAASEALGAPQVPFVMELFDPLRLSERGRAAYAVTGTSDSSRRLTSCCVGKPIPSAATRRPHCVERAN